ncbi:MAG: response regulator transcription factor [Lachnospiraceae bacterium]|nr:response regulator transcription factor [Lachnospiraceae bacterium]
MQYHILLVEDDPKIREAIIDFFSEKAPEYEMDIAKTGMEGLDKLEENRYDLILLDVMLPQMSGFDLIVKIRRTMDVPVIFMTARTSEEDRLYGYQLGCDDYVCKPFSLAELLAKVSALIKRSKGTVLDDILVCGTIQLHKRALTVRVNGEPVDLPPKELAILSILMERPGWTFSRDTLLDAAWGRDFFGNDRVVDNHVKKLRKSLGDAGDQIKTVFAKGYKITEK